MTHNKVKIQNQVKFLHLLRIVFLGYFCKLQQKIIKKENHQKAALSYIALFFSSNFLEVPVGKEFFRRAIIKFPLKISSKIRESKMRFCAKLFFL